MDIREIKYLHEIIKAGSIAKAAENLYISQPALSKAIKKIQKEIGISIFKKVGTRDILTNFGKQVIINSKPVLIAYSIFEHSIQSINASSKLIVNYGVIPYYCTPFTTNFLFKFKEKYPNIEVNVIEASEESIKDKLISGEIDVGMTEKLINSHYVKAFSGFQDDVAVAIGENNAFYNRACVSFSELENETFNIVTSDSVLYYQIMEGCRKAGFESKIGYQSSQIGLLLERTNANNGICILNRPMIYDYLEVNPMLNKIKIIKLNPAPRCFCWVLVRDNENLPFEIKIFAEALTYGLTEDTLLRIE